MLTHRDLKVRFLNRSEKDLSSDKYFAYLALVVLFLIKDLKKLSRYSKIECTPPLNEEVIET